MTRPVFILTRLLVRVPLLVIAFLWLPVLGNLYGGVENLFPLLPMIWVVLFFINVVYVFQSFSWKQYQIYLLKIEQDRQRKKFTETLSRRHRRWTHGQ